VGSGGELKQARPWNRHVSGPVGALDPDPPDALHLLIIEYQYIGLPIVFRLFQRNPKFGWRQSILLLPPANNDARGR
jgi:hypothetical protein